MKRLVLLKEGDYRANVFSDLVECVNNNAPHTDRSEFREKVNFFARTDFSYRLHANLTDSKSSGALALTTYLADPTNNNQDTKTFRPLNTNLMMEALEKYSFVLFAVLAEAFAVSEGEVLGAGIYIVRDNNTGHLLNYETGDRLLSDSESEVMQSALTFCGMVKTDLLPVYYLIIDSSIVHLGDGYDFHDDSKDVEYRKITDHDGTIKENLFVPTFSKGTTLIGKHNLLVTTKTLTIKFFDAPESVINSSNLVGSLPQISYEIDTNLKYKVKDNNITFTTGNDSPAVGYVKIKFNLGDFFEHAQRKEQPNFEYIIQKL